MKPCSVGRPVAAIALPAMMLAPTWPPIEPPRDRMTVFIPVATPVCSGGTASTMRLASEGEKKPMPMPRMVEAT